MERLKTERIIQAGLDRGADFVELFEEETRNSSVAFRNRKVETATAGTTYGIGIRLIYGADVLYADTGDDSEAHVIGLLDNLAASRGVIAPRAGGPSVKLTGRIRASQHLAVQDPRRIGQERKLDLVRSSDRTARAYSPQVVQVSVRAADSVSQILICNSDGLWVEDARFRCRFMVSVAAEAGGEMRMASEAPASLSGFEFFASAEVAECARIAAERAVTMLSAVHIKGGYMPVVLGNGVGGVIFHEACGHLLESESVRRKASAFQGRLGTEIAQPCLTAVDDGTIPHAWGSLNVDDEGMPARRTVLIDRGVLRSYMSDRVGAQEIGGPRTGSARRESYQFAPVARMRNTFIERGQDSRERMIGSIDDGLYAKKIGGGSVNPATGEFNFGVEEAYRIQHGRVGEPVRGTTLIGRGPDILPLISMVGDDLELAAGVCRATSGSVPTTVGQPTIKVDRILVGGR
jgi:TldD protein